MADSQSSAKYGAFVGVCAVCIVIAVIVVSVVYFVNEDNSNRNERFLEFLFGDDEDEVPAVRTDIDQPPTLDAVTDYGYAYPSRPWWGFGLYDYAPWYYYTYGGPWPYYGGSNSVTYNNYGPPPGRPGWKRRDSWKGSGSGRYAGYGRPRTGSYTSGSRGGSRGRGSGSRGGGRGGRR